MCFALFRFYRDEIRFNVTRTIYNRGGGINLFKNRDLILTILDISKNAVKAVEICYDIIFIYKPFLMHNIYMSTFSESCVIMLCCLLCFIPRRRIIY